MARNWKLTLSYNVLSPVNKQQYNETMKSLNFFIAFIIFSSVSSAGSIRGKVTLGNEKMTISGVSIHLVDKKVRFGTDRNGEFVIPNLTKGTFTIEAMQLGYTRSSVTVTLVSDNDVQEVSLHLEESPFQLNEVVVTGSFNKHLLKDAPVITEVIGRRDIERTGSADLSEVIRTQTGIELGTSIGQTQNVRMQGLNKNQVLVLVDGERMSGKVDDAVDLGQIPVNMIEKIEVVKGPLSSIYGSEAIGGVVNIITKNPKHAPSLHAGVTGGSNGRQDYELAAAHTFGGLFDSTHELSMLVNAGYNKYFGVTHYDTSFSFDGIPEYDRKNVDLKLNFSNGDRLQADVKAGYFEDYMIWQASSIDFYETETKATNRKRTLSSSLNYQLTNGSNIRVSAHYSENEHGSVKIANTGVHADPNIATEKVQTYRGQYTFIPYASSVLTIGAEHNSEGSTSGRLKEGARTIANDVAYVEDEWSIGDYTLAFGGRYSENSVFGGFFAPRLSFRYKATEKLTFRASYGRGFRAPSFIELFFDFNHSALNYVVEGNTALQPEKSHGFNFGIDYARDDIIWFRTNFYYNDVTNLIEDYIKQQATVGNPYTIFSYLNIAEAVTKGVDVDVDIQLHHTTLLSVGYNYTSATDGNGVELPFRTPHTVTVKGTYDHPAWGTSFNLRARWQDATLVNDRRQNNQTLTGAVEESDIVTPAHGVVDLKAIQPVYDMVQVSAGINNVLNKTVFPYGQIKGREFFAGIQIRL